MVIQFSPLANRAIDKYRKSLRLPKYHCTEEQANEKAQQMIQYIVDKISNTMIELQECPFIKLGKKRGTKGKDFNKKLKWFQYKVSANNAWGVSVLYPEFASWKFENRVSAQARVRFSLAGFIIFSDYISERIDG